MERLHVRPREGTDPDVRCSECGKPVDREERQLLIRRQLAQRETQGRAKSTSAQSAGVLKKLGTISADLKTLKRTGKPLKQILSQRTAAKVLGIGRPNLSALIANEQVSVVNVNGNAKISQHEIDRLIAEGFDADRPAPSRAKKKAAKVGAAELGASILKIKL